MIIQHKLLICEVVVVLFLLLLFLFRTQVNLNDLMFANVPFWISQSRSQEVLGSVILKSTYLIRNPKISLAPANQGSFGDRFSKLSSVKVKPLLIL
jgi:hypothetical protein